MELIPQDLNVLSRSFLTPDERPRMQEIFEVLQSCLLTEKYNCGAIESKYPRSFICRISVAVMKDPVVCSDGYSYEMEAAVNYRLLCSKSPVTGEVRENHMPEEILFYCAGCENDPRFELLTPQRIIIRKICSGDRLRHKIFGKVVQ